MKHRFVIWKRNAGLPIWVEVFPNLYLTWISLFRPGPVLPTSGRQKGLPENIKIENIIYVYILIVFQQIVDKKSRAVQSLWQHQQRKYNAFLKRAYVSSEYFTLLSHGVHKLLEISHLTCFLTLGEITIHIHSLH